MVDQEGFSTNRDSLLDETNYAFWSLRMRTYLMALGFDIWKWVITDYIAPKHPPTCVSGKNPTENNAKCMNAIFCGLSKSKFVKVINCGSIKEIWDKIQNIYEVYENARKEKLQTHRR
jgi:hypothetical protein